MHMHERGFLERACYPDDGCITGIDELCKEEAKPACDGAFMRIMSFDYMLYASD